MSFMEGEGSLGFSWACSTVKYRALTQVQSSGWENQGRVPGVGTEGMTSGSSSGDGEGAFQVGAHSE